MSLPADSATVAVLVLAWDETTPAVRALVAATEASEPTLDSVVVLVPAGPATSELTPEEFLPLAASLAPAAKPALPGAADELPPPANAAAPLAPATEAVSATPPLTKATPPVAPHVALPAAAPALPSPAAAGLVQPALFASELAGLAALTAALPGPAVRVFRLSEHSLATLGAYSQQALPAPAWRASAAAPAAPYLGSSAGTLITAEGGPMHASVAAPTPPPTVSLVSAAPTVAVGAAPTPAAAPAAARHQRAELPSASDAGPDTLPTPIPGRPAPAPAASTAALSAEAADEPSAARTAEASPVRAGWPAALASLQKPAAPTFGPADELATSPSHVADAAIEPIVPTSPAAVAGSSATALRPATGQFDAPNLNFQIIQYARFAVPLALATQPFAVIYAPAWPTWLAAQELRHRTGRPLVLHIAALAAQDEPVDLAAGWPAEIQRQALHRADLILTETPALAYRLRRELALPAHRVRPVPAADAAAVALALSTAHVA